MRSTWTVKFQRTPKYVAAVTESLRATELNSLSPICLKLKNAQNALQRIF